MPPDNRWKCYFSPKSLSWVRFVANPNYVFAVQYPAMKIQCRHDTTDSGVAPTRRNPVGCCYKRRGAIGRLKKRGKENVVGVPGWRIAPLLSKERVVIESPRRISGQAKDARVHNAVKNNTVIGGSGVPYVVTV